MEQQYNIREIVWAKVHPYPWWPGKIVKILQQNKKTVYKVSFFADPTYTFLHQSQLTPYLTFDHSLNDTYSHLPKLQKAIEMAATYYSRPTHKPQDDTHQMYFNPSSQFIEEQKREENVTQNIIFPQQKTDQTQQKPIQAQQISQQIFHPSQITLENVCQIIEMNRKRQKSCGYSYESRKQQTQLQQFLKKTLLMKYNLYECPIQTKRNDTLSKKKIIQITSQNTTSKQIKRICKQKSKNKHLLKDQIELLRVKCLRKIISILKESNQCVETSKIYAIKTMKRILSLAENNRIKLQSLFITLIKALTTNSSLQKCQQKLTQFNNYLQQLQNDKQEDEGSKITQIQAMN